jgi:hypothetical protein
MATRELSVVANRHNAAAAAKQRRARKVRHLDISNTVRKQKWGITLNRRRVDQRIDSTSERVSAMKATVAPLRGAIASRE